MSNKHQPQGGDSSPGALTDTYSAAACIVKDKHRRYMGSETW
ncbi:MAG: hypothetical protein R3C44_02585 [Chloroflexota bacterium]